MAPAQQAAGSARIVKLDASQDLAKPQKSQKAAKSGAGAGEKQKKRKAGQEASSDDESEEEIVGFVCQNWLFHMLMALPSGLCERRPRFFWFH